MTFFFFFYCFGTSLSTFLDPPLFMHVSLHLSTLSTSVNACVLIATANSNAGVVYLSDSDSKVHISLVIAKTKVASIKRLTIPRLELCGAYLLSQLLRHVRDLFSISMDNIFAWTDSTIVLGWLNGNPRRLKPLLVIEFHS